MVWRKDLDKVFGYALRIDSGPEARPLSKSQMRKGLDVWKVGCSARGLRAIGILCGVRFAFLGKEVRRREWDICARRDRKSVV